MPNISLDWPATASAIKIALSRMVGLVRRLVSRSGWAVSRYYAIVHDNFCLHLSPKEFLDT